MYETRLVGVSHRPIEIQILIEELVPGDKLTLVREPDNRYDSNAIQLHQGDDFLGYVRGTDAQEIAPFIDDGTEFVAEVIAGGTPRQPKVLIREVAAA